MKFFKLFLVLLLLPSHIVLEARTIEFIPGLAQLNEQNLSDYPVVRLDSLRGGMNIHFLIPKIDTKENNSFEEISVKGLNLTSDLHRPKLPFYSILVESLPEDIKIEMQKGTEVSLENFKPLPQEDLPCRCDSPKKLEPFNEAVYQEKQNFHYKKEYIGDFRGTPITRLLVFPSSFDGSTQKTIFYPQSSFFISHKNKKHFNIFSLKNHLLDTRKNEINKKIFVMGSSSLLKELTQWVNFKKSLGFSIDLVSFDNLEKTAENLRKFIHERWKNPKTRFGHALLIGHEKNFPTFYVPTSSNSETPSDLSYFTMGGEEDFILEVFYGRLVADSSQDVKNQIQKILNQEKAKISEKNSYIFGMASNEGSNPTDSEYLGRMLKPFDKTLKNLTVQKFLQDDPNSTPEEVLKAFGKNSLWTHYIGHGSGTEWVNLHQQRGFSIEHVSQLPKHSLFPIVIDVSCQNGRFTYQDRLGERLINAKNESGPLGPVAYYGGSVDISWHPPAIMAIGISEFANSAEGKKLGLGPTLLSGHLALLQQHSVKKDFQENITWYHLMGDPTIRLPSN